MTTIEGIKLCTLGTDRIELNATALDDAEVLEAARELYPVGFNLMGSNAGPVWINPKLILNLSSADGFGIEFVGMAHIAAELVRLAADPAKAETLGDQGCDRLIQMFIAAAKATAEGKASNQLHAVRFGVGAKIALAERVEDDVVEIHPHGLVAQMMVKVFGIHGADDRGDVLALDGQKMVYLRHPFLLAGIGTLRFNDKLSRSVVLMNRRTARKVTKCDADGDTMNFYPIEAQPAIALANQIAEVVPNADPTLLVRGISADDEEAEMWGENIFEAGKTTDKKLNQEFSKTVDEWLKTHAAMGECANTYTPFAYRISDVCGLMASLGLAGAQEAALIGAVVEEDYYLSLGGGPGEMNEALEDWMRNHLKRERQQEAFFTRMAEGVDQHLLNDTDVRNVLLDGAVINKQEHDAYDPIGALVHFGWLVGKGRVTTDPLAVQKLKILDEAIAGSEEAKPFAHSFLLKMATFAAKKLNGIVGQQAE